MSAETSEARDLEVCRDVLRRGSKSFTLASRLLPSRVRDPSAALYAFCRDTDDAIDADGSAAALDDVRERLASIARGAPRATPIDRAAARVIERSALPLAPLEALVEGYAWDAAGRRYASISELRAYGVRVAATVGVMMTWLMGPRDATTLARACDLGVAMQLTNIARDVGEDARNGRLYVPMEWMRDEGLDVDAFLAAPAHGPAIARVVDRLLGEADVLYARSERGVPRLPRDCRAAIRAARLIYAAIGDDLRRHDLDAIGRRAHTSRARKIGLALRALAGFPSGEGDASAPPLEEAAPLVWACAEAPS